MAFSRVFRFIALGLGLSCLLGLILEIFLLYFPDNPFSIWLIQNSTGTIASNFILVFYIIGTSVFLALFVVFHLLFLFLRKKYPLKINQYYQSNDIVIDASTEETEIDINNLAEKKENNNLRG